MAHFQNLKIETVTLDVMSDDSIAAAVKEVSSMTGGNLDVLVNNSGGGFSMPLSDVNIAEAKKLFDLNVFSYLAVTQAFLPLLMKSQQRKGAIIANNTSVVSVLPVPM